MFHYFLFLKRPTEALLRWLVELRDCKRRGALEVSVRVSVSRLIEPLVGIFID